MAIVLRMQHLLPLRELLDVWLPRNRHKDAEKCARFGWRVAPSGQSQLMRAQLRAGAPGPGA